MSDVVFCVGSGIMLMLFGVAMGRESYRRMIERRGSE